MLNGFLYDANYNEEIVKKREKAKDYFIVENIRMNSLKVTLKQLEEI